MRYLLALLALACYDLYGNPYDISRVEEKAKLIHIPELVFDAVPLFDAIDQLRALSVELDGLEPDSKRRGVNIVILGELLRQANEGNQPEISLRAKNISLKSALIYTAQIAGGVLDFQGEVATLGTQEETIALRRAMGLEIFFRYNQANPTDSELTSKVLQSEDVPHWINDLRLGMTVAEVASVTQQDLEVQRFGILLPPLPSGERPKIELLPPEPLNPEEFIYEAFFYVYFEEEVGVNLKFNPLSRLVGIETWLTPAKLKLLLEGVEKSEEGKNHDGQEEDLKKSRDEQASAPNTE